MRQTPPPPSVGSTHSNTYVCMVPEPGVQSQEIGKVIEAGVQSQEVAGAGLSADVTLEVCKLQNFKNLG